MAEESKSDVSKKVKQFWAGFLDGVAGGKIICCQGDLDFGGDLGSTPGKEGRGATRTQSFWARARSPAGSPGSGTQGPETPPPLPPVSARGFFAAARVGDAETVIRYLGQDNAEFNLRFPGEGTAMEIAYESEQYDVVEILGGRAANLYELEKVSFYGKHAFLLAAYLADGRLVRWLLRQDPGAIEGRDRDGATALHLAAQRAPPALLLALADAGAWDPVAPVDRNQLTPAAFAAQAGNLPGLAFLLDRFPAANEGCAPDEQSSKSFAVGEEVWARRMGYPGYWRATIVAVRRPPSPATGPPSRSSSPRKVPGPPGGGGGGGGDDAPAPEQQRPSWPGLDDSGSGSAGAGAATPPAREDAGRTFEVRYLEDGAEGRPRRVPGRFVRRRPPFGPGDRVEFLAGLRGHMFFTPGFVESVAADGTCLVRNPGATMRPLLRQPTDLVRSKFVDKLAFEAACDLGYSLSAKNYVATNNTAQPQELAGPLQVGCKSGDPDFFMLSGLAKLGIDLTTREGKGAFFQGLISGKVFGADSVDEQGLTDCCLQLERLTLIPARMFLMMSELVGFEACRRERLFEEGSDIDLDRPVIAIILDKNEEPALAASQYRAAQHFVRIYLEKQLSGQEDAYVWCSPCCMDPTDLGRQGAALALALARAALLLPRFAALGPGGVPSAGVPQTWNITPGGPGPRPNNPDPNWVHKAYATPSKSPRAEPAALYGAIAGKLITDLEQSLAPGSSASILFYCSLILGCAPHVAYQFGATSGTLAFLPLDGGDPGKEALETPSWSIAKVSKARMETVLSSFSSTGSAATSGAFARLAAQNGTAPEELDEQSLAGLKAILERKWTCFTTTTKKNKKNEEEADKIRKESLHFFLGRLAEILCTDTDGLATALGRSLATSQELRWEGGSGPAPAPAQGEDPADGKAAAARAFVDSALAACRPGAAATAAAGAAGAAAAADQEEGGAPPALLDFRALVATAGALLLAPPPPPPPGRGSAPS